MGLVKHCDLRFAAALRYRCNKPFPVGQDDIADFLGREYPTEDICPDCDLDITLAAETAKADALKKLPPGTTAKRMLDNYQ